MCYRHIALPGCQICLSTRCLLPPMYPYLYFTQFLQFYPFPFLINNTALTPLKGSDTIPNNFIFHVFYKNSLFCAQFNSFIQAAGMSRAGDFRSRNPYPQAHKLRRHASKQEELERKFTHSSSINTTIKMSVL